MHEEGIELFHNETEETFARLGVGRHHEIWPTGGKTFRGWMCGRFWKKDRKAPSSEALRSALNVIEAQARFEGEERQLANRVTLRDGAIYYDLADKAWRCVRITPDGWGIVDDAPALFRRYAHQKAQMEPTTGGDLRDLLQLVNIGRETDRLLLLVYLVSCLVPDIPHPIPVLHGPQGAAKTTLFRMLRRIIDPSAVEVLSIPRDATELVQQLSHHWAPLYDNLTSLRDWTSDVLARAVTGEGFSKRVLYTNDEDMIYHFRRCVGLNGINVVARKPDLLDRCILLRLERIEPEKRLPEQLLWRHFDERRPALVGAAFDALSRAMGIHPTVELTSFPRMADFAQWGCAIAEALGHGQEAFLSAYEANALTRNDEVLHDHPVATVVMALMDSTDDWEGTPSELLARLAEVAQELHVDLHAPRWPKAANSLSRRLNEVRPNLAATGITIQDAHDGKHRRLRLQKLPQNTVSIVNTVSESPTPCLPTSSASNGSNDTPEIPLAIPLGRKSLQDNDLNDPNGSNGICADFSDEEIEERAAIQEFDGGLPREEAERRARGQERKEDA